MQKAIFAGSFDPPTYGHLNVIERSAAVFDEVLVTIAVNRTKKYLFNDQERMEMMKKLTSRWNNVSVHLCDTLIVDFARKNDVHVLIRGVRNFADFSYEFDLSLLNRGLSSDIDTFFIPTDPEYFVLRSSAIKELASFGGDVSKMVPPEVEILLKKKFGGNAGQ